VAEEKRKTKKEKTKQKERKKRKPEPIHITSLEQLTKLLDEYALRVGESVRLYYQYMEKALKALQNLIVYMEYYSMNTEKGVTMNLIPRGHRANTNGVAESVMNVVSPGTSPLARYFS